MEVDPQKGYSDLIAKAEADFQQLQLLMRSFRPQDWLALIAQLDYHPILQLPIDQIRKHSVESSQLYFTSQHFILVALAHYALRCYVRLPGRVGKPDINHLHRARILFIESEVGFLKRAPVIFSPSDAAGALAGMLAEQWIGRPQELVPHNLIGRTAILYRRYESAIRSEIGLNLDELCMAGSAIMGSAWEAMERLRLPYPILTSSLSRNAPRPYFSREQLTRFLRKLVPAANVERFLDYFSCDIGAYQAFCAEHLGTAISRHEFTPILRFPIFRSDKSYCIPLRKLIISASTEHLFHVVLNAGRDRTSRQRVLEDFGHQFENYVTQLFGNVPFEINPCDSIPGISGRRAEFFVVHGSEALVVECKAHLFKRDTFYETTSDAIRKRLSQYIPDALGQIKNTMSHLKGLSTYGVIVSHDAVPLMNDLLGESWFGIPQNVIALSLAEVEVLTALSGEELFDTVRRLTRRERNNDDNLWSIVPREKSINPMLDAEYKRITSSMKKMMEETTDGEL